jgi:hypothetical protein
VSGVAIWRNSRYNESSVGESASKWCEVVVFNVFHSFFHKRLRKAPIFPRGRGVFHNTNGVFHRNSRRRTADFAAFSPSGFPHDEIFHKTTQNDRKGGRQMLYGRYEHNIDAKGRIFVPVSLRDKLGSHFMAAAVLDEYIASACTPTKNGKS